MQLKKSPPLNLLLTLTFIQFLAIPGLVSGQKVNNPERISFLSNNQKLQGWMYKPEESGPFSTIILLQGSRGNDGDTFNLGKNLSGKGYNVITYNYPGAWRSEGLRTNAAAQQSVKNAISYIKSERLIKIYSIDTADIILLGYSYGGGMALLSAAKDPTVGKVISIAGLDLSVFAESLENNPGFRKYHQQMLDNLYSNPEVARAPSGAEIHNEIIQSQNNYDLKKYAEQLAKKEILLIGGWQDQGVKIEDHILPLYREIDKLNPNCIDIIAFDTDHSFENVQNEMTKKILKWLNSSD